MDNETITDTPVITNIPVDEPTPTITIGELVEAYNKCGAEIKRLEAEAKKLKEEQQGWELQILAHLEAQGQTMSGVGNTIVSIEKKKHPQINDWEAFYKYIKDNNAFYLLQRRPSSAAVQELAAIEDVPGVGFYEETRLKTRSRR